MLEPPASSIRIRVMEKGKATVKGNVPRSNGVNIIDILINLSLPTLIIIHLLISPYTKVEESFNIQAIHDISTYGFPTKNITARFTTTYDHFSFPGAVPRSFVGALILSALSRPMFTFTGLYHAQVVVRAVLGLFNAFALVRYKGALERAFGKDTGRWYVLLQVTQFHVIYYASRTLPNMFAFGLTTLALKEFLPSPGPKNLKQEVKKQRTGIFFLVFAGVVFRSEIAILLFTQLLSLLVQSKISLKTIISAGITSAAIALAISIPIDSYFWQKPIWPELAGFYYNAIQGKSADWGTSPFGYYFTSLLPKLLINPLIQALLIPISIVFTSTKHHSLNLVVPSLLFVAVYSLQQHKEARFIIYVVPPLTAAASLAASYIWTRRSKTLLYRLGSLLLLISILGSFIASTAMLLISSLNYPGGEALAELHSKNIGYTRHTDLKSPTYHSSRHLTLKIHMDVLTCMTGVTRFLEIPHPFPFTPTTLPILKNTPTAITYDKTENTTLLLDPSFWTQFDYILMEDPGKAPGIYITEGIIYAYAGMEILRPGQDSKDDTFERLYAANRIVGGGWYGDLASEDVREALGSGDIDREVEKLKGDEGKEKVEWRELMDRWVNGEKSRFAIYCLVRDSVRFVTGGWWVGPRMGPSIWILRRDEVDDVV